MIKRIYNYIRSWLYPVIGVAVIIIIIMLEGCAALGGIQEISTTTLPANERVKTITARLVEANPEFSSNIVVRINPRKIYQASAIAHSLTSRYVVIYQGLLNYFKADNDAIAAVLAHEYAHHYYRHYYLKDDKYHEIQSDVLGAIASEKAGYDPCGAVRVLRMFRDVYGDEESSTHPTPSERLSALPYKCAINP